MNGVALALTLATLGVDYSYRTTEEGQLEYTIQIEPEFLQSLAEGEEIHSEVPPDVGQVQRLCLRIGMTPVRHTAASIQQFKRLQVAAPRFASNDPALAGGEAQRTIVWPARANPEESFGASYGWQPDQLGQLAYYVQIDATTLRTLAAGDEIHAVLDPAAGRVSRFVISSGNKQLPRVAPPPAEAATVTPLATSKTRNRFQTGDDVSTLPVTSRPPADSFRTGEYVPLATNSPAPVVETPNAYAPGPAQPRFNSPREPAAADPRGAAAPPSTGGYTGTLLEAPPRTQYNSPAATQPPAAYTTNEPVLNDPRGYTPGPPANSGRFDQFRSNTLQPPVDVAPPPSYVQPAQAEQPQYQQPTTRYSPPVNERLAASLPPASDPSTSSGIPVSTNPAGLTATTGEPQSLSGSPTGMMWLVAMFLLFLSIGGNLYLGWTAAEFYSRYRLAVDRLRTAGRA